VRVVVDTAAEVMNGFQASPSSTARRIARLELPPIRSGGCGSLDRTRQNAIAECLITGALKREFVRGPGGLHRLQVLIHDLVAALEVDAQGLELSLEVAGAHAQSHAPTGDVVECGHRASRDERIAVRQHENPGLHPQCAGGRRNEGQYDERVLRVMTACIEPASRGDRVIGIAAGVEAGALGRS
jgi:hypothetical protein